LTPIHHTAALAAMLLLGGCGNDYSPDTYATRAVQQANRAEQGVVAGRRQVQVRADGSTGAATGAAAGGLAGSQVGQGGAAAAFGAIGGGLVGGLLGAAGERAAGDTTAIEYIVRKANGELWTVTQRDERPLEIGQRVLLIGGTQARIVPDYTVPEPGPEPRLEPRAPAAVAAPPAEAAGSDAVPPLPPIQSEPLPGPASPEPARAAEPSEPAAPSASPVPAAGDGQLRI